MEQRKNYLFIFPQEVMYKPLIYRLVKEHEVIFNLLEAKIFPRKEGRIIMELIGEAADIAKGIAMMEAEGVKISKIADHIHRDEDKCVHCGACTAVCRSDALRLNRETMEVEFVAENCVACGLCETACPMKALRGVSIRKLGELAFEL